MPVVIVISHNYKFIKQFIVYSTEGFEIKGLRLGTWCLALAIGERKACEGWAPWDSLHEGFRWGGANSKKVWAL